MAEVPWHGNIAMISKERLITSYLSTLCMSWTLYFVQFECVFSIATSISKQNFSRSFMFKSFSIDNLKKSYKSSKWDFFSTKTDQISSSDGISQHIPWSSTMLECRRIAGWLNTIISLISAWKINSRLSLFIFLICLKAKLVCKLRNAWSILTVSPIPIASRVDCYVMSKKSISSFWAIARKNKKSYPASMN